MERAVKTKDAKKMGEFVGHYFEWVRRVTAAAFANYSLTQQHAVGNS